MNYNYVYGSMHISLLFVCLSYFWFDNSSRSCFDLILVSSSTVFLHLSLFCLFVDPSVSQQYSKQLAVYAQQQRRCFFFLR